ncbi:HlyD family type I secretion periplasmic adaptor subunit [Paraburkholderia silviterrae]|uniref:Membrane fusion protein (MFP) family protein n=2 Tax=Paraburkholderia silviterrae TaxID=2528715 RepID=A0A4R5M1R4_9BURK|nr:HlyD family type I secretion periplasmic adaptor subunit [Paraburkholderia silviterrae]
MRWALTACCGLAIFGFVAWAHWARIDQITRAQGQVIASSRDQIIQAQDLMTIDQVLVKEGAQVKRGQPLVRFERARAEAAWLESRSKAASLEAEVARLHAEVYGGKPQFPQDLDAYPDIRANEEVLFRKRQAAVDDEVASLSKALQYVQDELNINLPLLAAGDVSKAEVLKLERQVADLQGQIVNRRNKYLQDSQTDLSKALEDLAGVEQVVAQRKDQLDHTVIESPVDGIVRNVRITTPGGVARAGDEIMQILPVDDDLIIEAKVKPRDIAFLKRDLPAKIKLDAYDYTIYGTLQGTVTYISADTLSDETRQGNEQPYYRVQVKTDAGPFLHAHGRRLDVQPGMTATVEIKTGSNTVLRYLTKPLTKTLNDSLGER